MGKSQRGKKSPLGNGYIVYTLIKINSALHIIF